ncbi:MAG: M28 family metallopeptidase [Candidatus Aminicenantales bacterium]
MNPKKLMIPVILAVMAAAATTAYTEKADRSGQRSAPVSFDEKLLAHHVQVLASDEFEGRGPASKGEELTVAYISDEFRKLGLKPPVGGSYVQAVPMARITNDPKAILRIKGKGTGFEFHQGTQFVGWTLQAREEVAVADSDMVFVGYGVVAPEWNWDDYAGADVRGKTVVMLVNDPGFAAKDPELFKGKTMTYYGRWPYKFAEAARHGAAAALLVHETEPASYGWDVVNNSWMGARYSLSTPDGNATRCALDAWISLDMAKAIFSAAGQDYEAMKMAADKRGFRAVPLELKSSITMHDAVQNVISRNVVGLIPGTARPDEVVIYSAHWDHFGVNPAVPGEDKILNGAVDNATGISGLIELARAFMKPNVPHERSLLFLAVTAEEQGLLGSEYYVEHPLFPLAKTVADLNMDAMNVLAPTRDVATGDYGRCDLEDYFKTAAEEEGRVIAPDANPESGGYFRSDHFSFALAGVPAVTAGSGIDDREKGPEYGAKARYAWAVANYHKPSDEFSPSWNYAGMIEDLVLYYRVGLRLINETAFPGWKPGSDFKAKRDAMMGDRLHCP